ncbi:MAG TPA: APC family permease [Vicinamibacteria bacterium]|nr:APC family permease [Vicinamibacteria bacterium]
MKASTFQLVFMTYAVVCSGAYGLEEMVSRSGPGIAILTLLLLPVVWGAPVALACAELSARHPVEGGYYRWAAMAFGEFAGFMTGWLVYLSVFATNAAFAVLFVNYLRHFVPVEGLPRFLIAVALVWLTTFLNYRGIVLVGTAAVVMTVLIFLPFLGLTFAGLQQWRFDPLVPFVHPDKTPLAAFLASSGIAIWLFSGWEKLTVNAAEVENPRRAFPVALAWAVPMVAASYVVPTVVALAARGDWKDWGEAHFSAAALAIGGPALAAAMTAGALVSNACLLLVTILGQSRLPLVLAEDGFFPRAFTRKHPRYGSPHVSLFFGGGVLTALCALNFTELMELYSVVQVLAYMLIFASLVRLRSREGEAAGSGFRIPLPTSGVLVMIAPAVLLAAFVVFNALHPASGLGTKQTIGLVVLFGSGPVAYEVFRRLRARKVQPAALEANG